MKAVVYNGPGDREIADVPKPTIVKSTDAIVRIDATTICGTDLHILKGDVPAVKSGTILGHEGCGVVEEVGDAVTAFKPGDRVLLSCVTSCGSCFYCRRQLPSHCLDDEGAPGIGWIFGHLIDGTMAEYVRVPFADTSMYMLPDAVPYQSALMLSDILPTGFEIGVINGKVKPGDVVAVIGAGPVGLSVMMTAGFYGAARVIAVDLDENRLAKSHAFGATDHVRSSDPDWVDKVKELTDGLGVDVAVEAVGLPQTFDMCTKIVRPGGHIANVGVHGAPVELQLQDLWIEDLTITTGLVSTTTIPMLLKLVEQNKIEPTHFITHRFDFDQFEEAWQTFSNAADTKAMKVYISRT